MLRHPVRIVAAVLVFASYAVVEAQGQSVQYVYDPLGRLVAAIDLDGDTASYTYDAAGNLLSIKRYASWKLSLISFSPDSGPVGTRVTISGTGFSATPSQNAVTFHGVAAPVVSATVMQLVAVVPDEATTGPIEVTTLTGSVTSSTAFTVTVDGGTPSVTNVTPAIGGPGTPVSIIGTNFDPTVLNNRVRLNTGVTFVTGGSRTTLLTSVPYQTMGGPIQVATGGGTAVSPSDFYVPPAPYTPNDVAVTDRLTIGTSRIISIASSGKVGLVLFDGTVGQRASFRVTNSTIVGTHLTIYRPDGLVLYTSGPISASGGFIEPIALPIAGSYTILVDPDSTYTGSLTLSVHSVVDLAGSITADGIAVPVSITAPGQNARLMFSGNAGQVMTARLTNGTFSSYCWALFLSILRPDGTALGTVNSCSGSSALLDQVTLPTTGSYTFFFNPDAGQTGTATLTLYGIVDVTGSMTAGGTGVPVSITSPGQNARLTFSGTAGQVVTARVANGTFSSYCFDFSLSIVKTDGTTLGTTNSCSGSSAFLDQVRLPTTGSYTLFFNPDAAQTGTATLTLYDSADVTGSITPNGIGVPVSITSPGQNARLIFSGTAGQVVTARVANGTFSSYCFNFSLSIAKPDGTTLGTVNSCTGSGAFLDQVTLPATATYALIFNPDTTQTGNATLNLYRVVDVTGPIASGGIGVPVSITTPGQNVRLAFGGTAGQVVTARIANGTFSSYCFAFTLSILKSDGTTLGTINSCTGSGAFLDQVTLPSTGTYTLFFNPDTTQTGDATLTLYRIVDVTGSIAAGGTGVPVAITTPGQNVRLAFNGTAGQVVTARLTNGTFSSYCFAFSLSILKADGTALATSNSCSGSGAIVSQKTLPTTGAYLFVFNPDTTQTGTATLSLTSP